MHIHLDLVGGISGDMFVAALLDAFPDLEEELLSNLSSLDSLRQIEAEIIPYDDGVLTGKQFIVKNGKEDHHHRSYESIKRDLEDSSLDDRIVRRATAIFWELAQAEGKVHGKDPREVQFHEVGAWDSIADIVSAAFLIEKLAVGSWSVSPIPLGSGRVETAHGSLPVPAPATLILLENFPVFDDGLPGERVTPTGAAIIRNLNPATKKSSLPMRLIKSGYGFGSKAFPNLSNLLRVVAFDDTGGENDSILREELAEIVFELDDQTAEDLSVGIDHLRETEGVIDIIQAPVFGKKGRIFFHVQILAKPECVEQVIERCFKETTTIGVRWHKVYRRVLPRKIQSVTMEDREVRVKVVTRPGNTVTAKTEIDDVSDVKTFHERNRIRTKTEKNGIGKHDEE